MKAVKIALASLLYLATVVAVAILTKNRELIITVWFVGFIILGTFIDYLKNPDHYRTEGDIEDF